MKNFKKIILFIILLLTLISNLYSINPSADEIDVEDENYIEIIANDFDKSKPLKVSARNAIALDSRDNTVLWHQNGYEVVPMASTTKILTAIIAINYGNLDEKVTIGKNAAAIRGSTVGYGVGEEITMRELLFGLMFKSGNDAAIAIAESIGGSVDNFANIMNDYAKGLGIIDSHFESPHGLDGRTHYSSAYDLALLTSQGMKYEVFREIVGEKVITRDKYNFTRDYNNINKILHIIPNANGVKTGYTGGAGKCLVSSVKYEDRNIIMVVLNCVDRWNQTEKIFNYVKNTNTFCAKKNTDLVNEEEFTKLKDFIIEEDINYPNDDDYIINMELYNTINNLREGDVIGKIILKNKNEEVNRYNLRINKNMSLKEYNILINKEKVED